jgi:hypothetical protein
MQTDDLNLDDLNQEEQKRFWKGHDLNQEHQRAVRAICYAFGKKVAERGATHDASKFEDPERRPFNLGATILRDTTYGSDEYRASLKDQLGEALAHHYANNRHHPEHFENGVDDMTLIDLLEMFCDWLAAVRRHADGDIYKSIEHNTERFGLSPQLAAILRNTAKAFEEDDL